MTRIRITPEELTRTAQQMAEISSRITQVASELNSASSGFSPRPYYPELYGKISRYVASAQNAAQGPASKTSAHATSLDGTARAFTEADLFSGTHVAASSAQFRQVLGAATTSAGWIAAVKELIDKARRFLHLGDLNGGSSSSSVPVPGAIPSNSESVAIPTRVSSKQEIEQIIGRDHLEFLDRHYSQCTDWAQLRRERLGANKLVPTGVYRDRNGLGNNSTDRDLGADKYINIYANSVIRINDTNLTQLKGNIKPATALVWRRDQVGNNGAGHIAIVEGVDQDGIWVSEANFERTGEVSVRKITFDELNGLYLIPPDAEPVTENFETTNWFVK